MNTTTDIFGNELHRYSIADGIRDKNVLGFDPTMVMTYRDQELREAVALDKVKAQTILDVFSDPKKEEVYYTYMDQTKVSMAGYRGDDGKYIRGIEDYLSDAQYDRNKHRESALNNI